MNQNMSKMVQKISNKKMRFTIYATISDFLKCSNRSRKKNTKMSLLISLVKMKIAKFLQLLVVFFGENSFFCKNGAKTKKNKDLKKKRIF